MLQKNSAALAINTELDSIATDCIDTINNKNLTPQQQQKNYELIQKRKIEFIKLLYQYSASQLITDLEEANFTQVLIEITYELEKMETRQNFGITPQPKILPMNVITMKDLKFEGSATVASVNQTASARLVNGIRVFIKNTKPYIAQLEIVAADFFRQTLGRTRTSHGKIVIDNDKKIITGMYVEAIPGFISMRQLTDLAKNPSVYQIIQKKIDDLDSEITDLQNAITPNDKAKLKEKRNLLGTYAQIRDLQLIDIENKRIAINKIPQIISKALCSAFYYEDWDRHKDNFGISYDEDSKSKELGVASLDYDKSLTGTFHQDNKLFNWNITPEILKDFPNFNSWYWPTQSKTKTFLGKLAKIFTPEKIPKMYSTEEARQYASLKDNPEFQQQSHIEWLKLIFTPENLRQLTVQKFVSASQLPLQDIPAILEKKRQTLLNAAIQLNSFRERLNACPKILDAVKEELKTNLSSVEFKIVEKNWIATSQEIIDKTKRVDAYEEIAKTLDYNQLLAAIKRTGISFSPTLHISDKEFQEKLIKTLSLTNWKSSKSLRDKLNKEFGLNVSENDVYAIKQELYIKSIEKFAPEVFKAIGEINTKTSFTIASIEKLQKILAQYKTSPQKIESTIKTAITCLRNLGVSESVTSDTVLKEAINTDCQKAAIVSRQTWMKDRTPSLKPISPVFNVQQSTPKQRQNQLAATLKCPR